MRLSEAEQKPVGEAAIYMYMDIRNTCRRQGQR